MISVRIPNGAEPAMGEVVGGRLRHAGPGHEDLEKLGAEQDQEDHAARARGLEQRLDEAAPRQPAEPEAVERDEEDADRRRRGRVVDAGIDAADDDAEDDRDRDDGEARGEKFLPRHRLPLRARAGDEAHIDRDRRHEQDHRQDARDQRGGEHRDDVGLDDDRIDDRARRRAGSGCRACRRRRSCRWRATARTCSAAVPAARPAPWSRRWRWRSRRARRSRRRPRPPPWRRRRGTARARRWRPGTDRATGRSATRARPSG